MANYRTTVILKTDVVDSTLRLSELTQAEMGLQRKQHKQFISEISIKYQGSVFQEEGDAYWIEFLSVTDSVLAAIDMHQSLRFMQAGQGEKQRLAIRAVITVGDILHQETDSIGMAMSLTARIEKVTPPDEIYLSHAAWLVLNKAEVQTSFVGEFNLKGFSEPEKVYRVKQKQGIRVLTDQYIVVADAKGFGNFYKSTGTEGVEMFLLEYDELMNDICAKHGGTIRQINGDLYFLTFADADQTISALIMLAAMWTNISERYPVGLDVGAHKGNLHLFRSYVFGDGINVAVALAELNKDKDSDHHEIFMSISDEIINALKIVRDDIAFLDLDTTVFGDDIRQGSFYERRAYRLVVQ